MKVWVLTGIPPYEQLPRVLGVYGSLESLNEAKVDWLEHNYYSLIEDEFYVE